jgi:hypothetical protein
MRCTKPLDNEGFGEWNWYLPRWLEWLPSLAVEGSSEVDATETPAAAEPM